MSIIRWMDTNLYQDYGDNWDNKRYRDFIISRLDKTHAILDVGAGRGYVMEMDFRRKARFFAGVDPDPVVLNNLFLDEAKVLLDDGVIPYHPETFDLVFTNSVLEHVKDPLPFLGEVHRVLKPDGLFLTKTPNKYHYVSLLARVTPHSFHEFINKQRGRRTVDTYPTYHRLNSVKEIEQFANQCGFELLDIQLWEGRPEYLRIFAITYFWGYLYERIVNSSSIWLWCINPKGSYNRRNDFLLRLMVRKPGSYQAFPNGSCY